MADGRRTAVAEDESQIAAIQRRADQDTNPDMTRPIRSVLVLSILAVAVAACAPAAGSPSATPDSPSQPAAPSVEPSVAPSEEATQDREVVGTITVAEMAFSGPGATIAETIPNGDSGELPDLVNGVIFLDTDGTIYLASAVTDTTAPAFEGPMLEVLNMASDGPEWDMESAELLGLEEANGIVFRQEAQVLGFIDVP
jgi:hypothetical protein